MRDFYLKEVKRKIDIILTGIGLIVAGPFMGMIAVLIKLSSFKDPVIYKQVRVGKGGEFFTLYKFRTMKNEAEVKKHPNGKGNVDDIFLDTQITHKGDTRITFLGRILRKTALDELPQLFNVIRGDMSIVGPRPERPIFYPKYMDILKERIEVSPGLFGLVEVKYGLSDHNGNGNGGIDLNSEEGQRERMRLDREYIKKCSFWYDLKLVLIMIWKLLLREYYFSKIFWDKKNGNGKGNHHKVKIKEYIWHEKKIFHVVKG